MSPVYSFHKHSNKGSLRSEKSEDIEMNFRLTRRSLALVAILGLGAALSAATETRLRTRLAGPRIEGMTPSGSADFRGGAGRARLNVQVEDVNLPAGTEVNVFLISDSVAKKLGTITISAAPTRGGELELNTQDGEVVPAAEKGDMIVVRHPAGRILAGIF